jgi:hypothetical protein
MPVLLLSRGDTEAKDLLRRAIEARYGFSPPALETLQLAVTGRVHASLGPIKTWLKLDATTTFKFPLAARRDYSLKFMGFPLRSSSESFDGTIFRQDAEIVTDPQAVASIQQRTWVMSALLLTPLTEQHVELVTRGANSIEARHIDTDDHVTLLLNEDHSLATLTTRSIHPQTGREQNFTLKLSKKQITLDGLIVPEKITAQWDNTVWYEAHPVNAQPNIELADDYFSGNDD